MEDHATSGSRLTLQIDLTRRSVARKRRNLVGDELGRTVPAYERPRIGRLVGALSLGFVTIQIISDTSVNGCQAHVHPARCGGHRDAQIPPVTCAPDRARCAA